MLQSMETPSSAVAAIKHPSFPDKDSSQVTYPKLVHRLVCLEEFIAATMMPRDKKSPRNHSNPTIQIDAIKRMKYFECKTFIIDY